MYFGSLFDDGNEKEEQGEFGEARVRKKILRIRDQLGEFYFYNDMYIENGDRIYQIDHILLTSNGVFVIETKAVSGKVYATKDGELWTSIIYGKRTTFLNPIYQNNLHINALKQVLGNEFKYHSVIVFTERNKPNNVAINIVNIKELQDYLLGFKSTKKINHEGMMHIKIFLDETQQNRAQLKVKHKQMLDTFKH